MLGAFALFPPAAHNSCDICLLVCQTRGAPVGNGDVLASAYARIPVLGWRRRRAKSVEQARLYGGVSASTDTCCTRGVVHEYYCVQPVYHKHRARDAGMQEHFY
jgi:hypothetical protein